MQTRISEIHTEEHPGRGPGGTIIRQLKPENLEFPFESLNSVITPNEQFFVRSHFTKPELDVNTWRLHVEGEVERALELSFDEIRRMPSKTVTALLECSGNGRVFLEPKAVGVPWELGAVSTARWTGVPLREVLGRAKIKADAIEIILQGADSGRPLDEPKDPGTIPFARSLPLAKALDPDVLLAYEMNGEPLPPAHGFPLRVIVPDWYAMASIKWLTRIIATPRPFYGYYQTFEYSRFEEDNGVLSLVPLTEMDPKAQIALPAPHEIVPANSKYRIFGAAWSGSAPVAKVAISTDGGSRWNDARLLGDAEPHAWQFWEYDWMTPAGPTLRSLMARATDALGRVQPMTRDPRRLNAMISHVLPIEVEVR